MAFFLNTPDHFIARDLVPFSEILNMPGIPELLVADSHCIGETITIKQTYDEAVGCRHLEWLLVLVIVSHVCPSPLGTGQRRKRLLNLIVRGIVVCSFNDCTTLTLLAFKGFNWPSTATDELVSGKKKKLVEVRRVLGLRIQIGQRCSQMDLHVLCSYSPKKRPRVATRSGARLVTDSEGDESEAWDCYQGLSVGVGGWLKT